MISAMEDLSIHSVNYHHFSLSLRCCSCRDTHQLFSVQNHLEMQDHPVWLIEVEEDLFLISFFQFYQSTRMMMLQWNTTYQTQWIEEKWDLTLQMIRLNGMHDHPVWLIEVDDSLLIIQFYTHTNQGEWWCATHPFPLFHIIIPAEAVWTNINGPNWRDVWYFKCCSHSECSFTQFNRVKLRNFYQFI